MKLKYSVVFSTKSDTKELLSTCNLSEAIEKYNEMVNLFEKGPANNAELISSKFINKELENDIYFEVSATLELQILTKEDDEEEYELEDWCEYSLIDTSMIDKETYDYIMEGVELVSASEEDAKKMRWM